MISDDRNYRLSIDNAIAKELKRRAFVTWFLWILIILALALTVLVVYKGKKISNDVAKKIDKKSSEMAKELSSDPDFTDKVSISLVSDNERIASPVARLLSQDKDFQAGISKELGSKPDFAATEAHELINNANFVNRIANEVSREVYTNLAQEILRDSLKKDHDLRIKLQKRVLSLEAKLSEVMEELKSIRNVNEDHQQNIADLMHWKNFSEKPSYPGINQFEEQLQTLKNDVESLKQKDINLPQVYLLKTGQWNQLTDLGMDVKLGGKKGEKISGFTIKTKEGVTCDCDNSSEIRLGEQFFCKIGANRYRVKLIYIVTKLFLNDYVGMEIKLVSRS